MIEQYFANIRRKLNEIRSLIISDSIEFKRITDEMGIIKGRIVFINASIFEFKELVSMDDHSYRFHWMDKNHKLISRWDMAPHHKEIDTFPFHQHLPTGVQPSKEKKLADIIDVIKRDLIRELNA